MISIPIQRPAIIAGAMFIGVMAIPKGNAILASLAPQPAIGGPVEESSADEPATIPEPSSEGARAWGQAVQVRATYLLGIAQSKGDAFTWLSEHEAKLLEQANLYRAGVGNFAGDATQFAKLTNLSAELAACELVRHWLLYPADRNTVPSAPLNQPLSTFTEGETGYGQQW